MKKRRVRLVIAVVLMAFVLLIGVHTIFAVPSVSAAGGGAKCHVTNMTTGVIYADPSPQLAIDVSSPGDILEVRGACYVSNTLGIGSIATISHTLTLRGVISETGGYPGRLMSDHSDVVLHLKGTDPITITNMLLTSSDENTIVLVESSGRITFLQNEIIFTPGGLSSGIFGVHIVSPTRQVFFDSNVFSGRSTGLRVDSCDFAGCSRVNMVHTTFEDNLSPIGTLGGHVYLTNTLMLDNSFGVGASAGNVISMTYTLWDASPTSFGGAGVFIHTNSIFGTAALVNPILWNFSPQAGSSDTCGAGIFAGSLFDSNGVSRDLVTPDLGAFKCVTPSAVNLVASQVVIAPLSNVVLMVCALLGAFSLFLIYLLRRRVAIRVNSAIRN